MNISFGKIDKFVALLGVILIAIAAMLIFTFRIVFQSMTIAFDVGKVDTESELRIDTVKLEEAKKFALGQKTVIPLNIKNYTVPVVSVVPKQPTR